MELQNCYDEVVANIKTYNETIDTSILNSEIFCYSIKMYKSELFKNQRKTQNTISIYDKTNIYKSLFNIAIICLNYLSFILEKDKEHIMQENRDLFLKKNHDYGNSFQDYGLIGILVRLNDKINRLMSLYETKTQTQVNDEKIQDTIDDLYNYAVIGLMYKSDYFNQECFV